MKRNWRPKRLILILTAICMLGISPYFLVHASDETGSVTVSIEKFSIGQGYLIEPVSIAIEEGDTASVVLDRLLKNAGYTYTNAGSPAADFYLTGIHQADSGNVDIPKVIQTLGDQSNIPPSNESNDGNILFPALGEGSYCSQAGWLYLINNQSPGYGMDKQVLKNGDVMRVQFSLFGWGRDIGSGENALILANKDQLTQMIAFIHADENKWFQINGLENLYREAVKVLTVLDAKQDQIDSYYQSLLQYVKGDFPTIPKDPTQTESPAASKAPATETATTGNKTMKSVQEIKDSLKRVKEYLLQNDKNPGMNSQWIIVGLERSGLKVPKDYIDLFYQNVVKVLKEKKGILTNTKYTEYSKLIISLTSIGKNAMNVEEYNLLSYLSDFSNVTKQGINGPIWALLALHSDEDYTIPKVEGVSEQTTDEKCVNYILEHECKKGGWSLSGTEPDIDLTAMAVQALAPYYHKGNVKTDTALDKAVALLSEMQNKKDAGYENNKVENCESTSQVIMALTSMGLHPESDKRFVKNGQTMIENLFTYQTKEGGFSHLTGGKADLIATEQAFCALSAYKKMLNQEENQNVSSDIPAKNSTSGSIVYQEKKHLTKKKINTNTKKKSTIISAKKKEKKTSTQTKEKETFQPWSFDTGNYVPKAQEASQNMSTNPAEKKSEKTLVYYVIGGGSAAFLFTGTLLYRKRKRRLL